jgi:hypothetical protein
MAIFVVLPRVPSVRLDQRIKEVFPEDAIQLSSDQWLISFTGTVIALSEKLGITGQPDGTPAVASALVAQMGSYYGRAPQVVWDWIKTKLESSNG